VLRRHGGGRREEKIGSRPQNLCVKCTKISRGVFGERDQTTREEEEKKSITISGEL